jgi:NAD(P)-dependent dehydrogenase (short-subunit alcohol dehydrogenase family)
MTPLGDQAGKIAVVTGATSGIGAVVANQLAARGARVLVVARDPHRAAATLAALPPPAEGAHRAFLGDLSRLEDMKRVAGEISAAESAVDLLVNNAGAEYATRLLTGDGLEMTFALNHLSYFVTTLGLLDRLKASPQGRVVNTASQMHAFYKLDFDDLQMARSYDGYAAYGRSKLCNILFTRALARRLAGSNVTANALHPGFVGTRFGDDDRTPFGTLVRWAKAAVSIKPEAGASTTLHVSTSEDGGRVSGGYFMKSRLAQPSRAALKDADGERLWATSLSLAGLAQ